MDVQPSYVALASRAAHRLEQGDFDAAIDDLTAAAACAPDDETRAAVLCNRAHAYNQKGLYDKAVEDATKAIELNPECAPAYHNRALALEGKELMDKALDDHNKACELRPMVEQYRKAKEAAQAAVADKAGASFARRMSTGPSRRPPPPPAVKTEVKTPTPALREQGKQYRGTGKYTDIVVTDEEIASVLGKGVDVTPEIRQAYIEYKAQLLRFPVLKRWKPLLSACVDVSMLGVSRPKVQLKPMKPKPAVSPLKLLKFTP